MSNIKIRDIRVILTAPRDINLVVVKVETTEPGLYGVGCATFTQRSNLVATAVTDYLKPLLKGRSVDNIEDIRQLCMVNAYWRNGPVLNNAVGGINEALWDIKGKIAGMPVYDLLGGKCREGAAVYTQAIGNTMEELIKKVDIFRKEGYRYLRVQLGAYGGTPKNIIKPCHAPDGAYFNPAEYVTEQLEMFQELRKRYGFDLELLHDIHERLSLSEAMRFAKMLEPYNLFYLEDAVAVENMESIRRLREHTVTPLAIGELFTHPQEWKQVISHQLIDYIRVHISQIGGLSPAFKLAGFCEQYGIRTAWHGPGDITPVGMMAQLHLDLCVPNFGIQEFNGFSQAELDVFPGAPRVINGYMYANDKPGFGIDINEEEAAKYPGRFHNNRWTQTRRPDGTVCWP